MAEIFLARLQGVAGFEKLVCIKRILPHLARDKQFVAMFLDEARIASRISHPNVCQVFELGELEGSYYIAMEYLEGVPLACFRRPDYYGEMPDPRLVAGIAVQACEGLHHAHQLRNGDGSVMEVVHRDISPQNLFVTVDGIVKVLDFGIAKVQDATMKTSTGAVKGTYAYMAPEQLRGERVDRRADVFALGIVMWETLTRRHLFKRETDFLTFQAITSDPIEDVRESRPDVPSALSAVIMTALSRDREERYPTARMFGEAIAAAIQPLAVAAISEEIARAFPAELGEQAALIRVAREGGAFLLDTDRGPSVGHGADLLTTPASQLMAYARARPDAARPVSQPGSARPVSSGGVAQPVARPIAPSRSWRPLLIAVLALAFGGGGAYIYMLLVRTPPPVARAPVAGTKVLAQVAPVDAAVPVEDAGPVDDAALASPQGPDVIDAAAPPAPVGSNTEDTQPDKRPRRPGTSSSAQKSNGPPGFITIDSSPVYAVIYIDGKNYGETPLVKIALPPGRHAVHAVAPSGATRDVRITIESGKVAPASRIEW